jgi:hypothetical protein
MPGRTSSPTPSLRETGCVTAGMKESDVRLRGDVDGDGEEEDVYSLTDPRGKPPCRALLFAGTYSTSIDLLDDYVLRLGLPAPVALADVDGRAGAEIIVKVHAGASTEFLALYAVRAAALVRLSIEGRGDDAFGYGGSVTHLEGVDCSAAGEVVAAAAAPAPRAERYRVVRTTYEVDDDRLAISGRERKTIAAADLDSVPELAAPPFSSCS